MPTFREIERFCRKDGWEVIKEKKKHIHFRKIMDDGTIKRTCVSRGTGEVKGHLWKEILNNQLQVSLEYFNKTK